MFSPEANESVKRLDARDRAIMRDGIETHLRHEPEKTSRSRIKRLRGISRPQYRLRVGDFRVFYDVRRAEAVVEVLDIVRKPEAHLWLERRGDP